ncbi:MAG: nucleotidyl transferase AbiEii/AbiGii toxin family protein [FCB group bacterium]|nr:nucleotidyl transferase AbiEii/AbiGii toxin family protein [FCB group bacterium]
MSGENGYASISESDGSKVKKQIKNVEASVRARLLKIAKASNRDFNAVLLQYFQERLLYRLSISIYKYNFILKGALLYLAFDISRIRPTKDIDFLGVDTPNSEEKLLEMFQDIILLEEKDGVKFDANSLKSEQIIEDADYQGIRIYCVANLGKAKKRMHFDIGFGDKIVPGPVSLDFPVLLADSSVPKLRAYTPESSIAEKFEAIVKLNYATSRMKDFYDIYFMVRHYKFDLKILKKAIETTFKNRGTDLSSRSIIYTKDFLNDATNQTQWRAFLLRMALDTDITFEACIIIIRDFIEAVL